MKNNSNEKEISDNIFELSEQNIYKMLENLKDNHCIDKSLIYCYIKAFYIHTLKLILQNKKSNINFDKVYFEYKENLTLYYKTNNPSISKEILDDVLHFFDNSYSLISSVELESIDDSYEFRHYTINVFELLRMILEKKSKSIIRENIFESYTKIVIETVEKIYQYVK